MDGTTAAIGAELDDTAGGRDAGAVYLYRLVGGRKPSWRFSQRLTASLAGSGYLGSLRFGPALALEGARLVVTGTGSSGPYQKDAFV